MRHLALALLIVALSGCASSPASSSSSARATTLAASKAADASWSIEARLVESCCCNAICPCIVGSPPTHGMCTGNRLVEIEHGNYGAVDVSGVTLVVAFYVGEWSKYYFAEGTTPAQIEATKALLAKGGGFLFGDLLEVATGPLLVERTDGRIHYTYLRGETDVEVMRGFEGQPITVDNLASFRGYTQYESKLVRHVPSAEQDAAQGFELSGTNGFDCRFKKSG